MNARSEADTLLHEIQSKCATLRTAAKAVKNMPPDEARKIRGLMVEQAEEILRAARSLQEISGERLI